MKLEFNPKLIAGGGTSIYLLDEPGSYLHARAQQKLCSKLQRLSESNRVIYCTHSHYLLDPETIPVSSIRVADKDGKGTVTLVPITNYKGATTERRSALQPVLDALEIKPFALDLMSTRLTVITEGMYDYMALDLFKGDRPIAILPSVNAESIKFYISLMIAWCLDFRAIWDNDLEGRKRHEQAVQLFGEVVAERNLRLLPSPSTATKTILQDLFIGEDLVMVRRELDLDTSSSFERTLHALFYSKSRTRIMNLISAQTNENFESLLTSLSLSD